ncbi:DUF3658 domain-containing protein [Polaribacter atrinae]|uniref:DUF1835 domain-containing protein n=1 Tax=Polaribacter atrinae TaxID=1333662 RepID=A0A176T0M7_9FLAO|nr:DUF3658 domain-containing protein [Polaribacter atrinae]OAD41442.1 hypothetical protein LPB303_15380 [Polaribacter atrinae]
MSYLHIVNGSSAAGLLSFVLRENKINKENKVCCFNDFLAVGSLYNLTTKEGIEQRSTYLYNLINRTSREKKSSKEIQKDLTTFYKHTFNNYEKVIVWFGENTSEELLKLLCCNLVKQSLLYEINVSSEKIEEYKLRAVPECSPEIVKQLLPKAIKISKNEYEDNNKEWNKINQSKSLLRIYQAKKIESVQEDYFDKSILEECKNEYTLLLKITGQVMGKNKQLITDTFIIYRILYLIETNQLAFLGNLKNIREVKIKITGGNTVYN